MLLYTERAQFYNRNRIRGIKASRALCFCSAVPAQRAAWQCMQDGALPPLPPCCNACLPACCLPARLRTAPWVYDP